MSRLDEALLRLERAVARLEVGYRSRQTEADAAAARRLAESEAENRRLRTAAGEIAARVDAALGKVGRALEGEG
jgi:hypothetical protein